jgi:hypothetical protein
VCKQEAFPALRDEPGRWCAYHFDRQLD